MDEANEITFNEHFDAMRMDASEAIGDLAGELCNVHGFEMPVVLKMLRSAIDGFEAYMMASPQHVCEDCGGPLDDCDDDDEDDDDFTPSNN